MLLLTMFLLVFVDSCLSQYVYGGVVPYESRYGSRRPVRRSAIEALERLRLPVTRYFPQVDNQVAPAPYPYQWSNGDLYALPPQWSEDLVQQMPQEEEEVAVPDYVNYDYEPAFNGGYQRQPQPYADEVFPQEVDAEAAGDASVYNDLMSRYLMESPDMFENVQRRSDATDMGVDQSPDVRESNDKTGGSTNATTTTTAAAPTPAAQNPPPVQMTAVPAAPEKKDVKSLIVPDAVPVPSPQQAEEDVTGQKEEPLFRPLQSSQRTTWSEMDISQLPRVKNAQHKSPIPLLKQMIKNGPQKSPMDPLLEELNNLKKKKASV